jgi:hypothetical protein
MVLTAPTHVKIDTIGSQFDTVVYLRKGSCESGRELGCSDDAGSSSSGWPSYAGLDFTILYPGVYYLFLDGFTVTQNGPDSGPFVLNVNLTANPPEVCGDGIDNDGDVYVDCADSDCVNRPECQCHAGPSGPEWGPQACNDGIDNDCDGKIDAADKEDCNASPEYTTEVCNGQDDNGNNIIDDFACKCATDADCASIGQLCYTQTTHTCGLPCNQILGIPPLGICGSVAPGSQCSDQTTGGTGQCTFP